MAGTVIMTISDLSEMEARVDVGEVDVVLIAVCQVAHLEVDSFKDRKFNGVVTDIANSANNNDTSTTTSTATTTSTDATKFQVKIHVAEKEMFLPGMSVTANVETRYRTNVLSVPIQSVTTRLPLPAAGNDQFFDGQRHQCPASTNLVSDDRHQCHRQNPTSRPNRSRLFLSSKGTMSKWFRSSGA